MPQTHPASNLLTAQSFRKWKVSPGSLGAEEGSVTLKLDRLSRVRSVSCDFLHLFKLCIAVHYGEQYRVLLTGTDVSLHLCYLAHIVC